MVSVIRLALPPGLRAEREPELLRARVLVGLVAERQQASLRIHSEAMFEPSCIMLIQIKHQLARHLRFDDLIQEPILIAKTDRLGFIN